MSNLLAIRNDIKARVIASGTTKDAIIDDCIRQALRRFQYRSYWFLETIQNLSVPASAVSVSVPDNIGLIEAAALVWDGRIYRANSGFEYMKYTDLAERYLDRTTLTTSKPVACAQRGKVLYLSHAASQTCNIRLTCFVKDSVLPTADSDTSVWFNEGYEVIRSLAQFFFEQQHEQNTEVSPYHHETALRELDRQHERVFMGSF